MLLWRNVELHEFDESGRRVVLGIMINTKQRQEMSSSGPGSKKVPGFYLPGVSERLG
jgi:hypothetical protein